MQYLSDLMEKEIINICDGSRLGYIEDVILNIKEGNVCSFIISNKKQCFCFFEKKEEELKISLNNIVRIGDDIILVEIKLPQNH